MRADRAGQADVTRHILQPDAERAVADDADGAVVGEISGQRTAEADARRIIAFDRDRARIDDIAGKGARRRDADAVAADGERAVDVAVIVDVGRRIGFADGDLAARAVGDPARRTGVCEDTRGAVDVAELDRAFVDDLVIAVDGDSRAGDRGLDRAGCDDLDVVGGARFDRRRAHRRRGGGADRRLGIGGGRKEGGQAGGGQQGFAHRVPLEIGAGMSSRRQSQDGAVPA